jgi:dihydrofolate reductase
MPDTTCHMSISLDGFVAGPDQSREHPLGKRGGELHRWHMGDERANEADQTAISWLMRPRGAYVMGRNMFGPIRGDWEEDWRGWWGPEPPYHAPVFVLTHHAREPIEMEGGTTFHFATDGFDAAYAQARDTAGEDGVDIAGGASAVRQALIAGVVDELTLDIPGPARVRRADLRRRRISRVGAHRGAAFAAGHAHPLPPGGLKARFPANLRLRTDDVRTRSAQDSSTG